MVEDLPVGVQQRVEIVKVLFRDAEVIVFDEPTAVLTPSGSGRVLLGSSVRCATVAPGSYSSPTSSKRCWRSPTASRCCDGVRSSAPRSPGRFSDEQLAEMMVGRPVELTVSKEEAQPGEPVVEVSDLTVLDDRKPCRSPG